MGRIIVLILSLCAFSVDEQLEEAHRLYVEGETTRDDAVAMQAFNEALEIYRSLAKEHACSALYANIGGCYYQLGEFPWALLYCERAHALAPRDRHIRNLLEKSRDAAGIVSERQATPLLAQLLGAGWISVSERVWAALGCGALMALFGSLAIWRPHYIYMRIAVGWAACAAFLLGSAVVVGVCVSPTGIVIKAALVRVDGGAHYATVDDQPLLAGSKVFVKGASVDGAWALVVTGDGKQGYVPAENLGFR